MLLVRGERILGSHCSAQCFIVYFILQLFTGETPCLKLYFINTESFMSDTKEEIAAALPRESK